MNWHTILLYIYIFIIVSTILTVLLENRNPLKALSWVTILVLLPGVGFVLYLMVGKDTRRHRIISKRSYERIMQSATPEAPIGVVSEPNDLIREHQRLKEMILQQTSNSVMEADNLELFTAGKEKLEALIADIKSAKHHIHIQYYIIRDDKTGTQLQEALIEKAQEGIEVRVLYDHVGSFNTSKAYFREMRAAGIEVYPILEVVFPALTSKINYRNHRKIVVIDGSIGYVGGMNIADHYTYGNKLGKWRDTHARITGRAVNALQAAFMTDWYVASRKVLPKSFFYNSIIGGGSTLSYDSSRVRSCIDHNVMMQTFTSGPTGSFRILQQVLCRAIYEAKRSVRIQTPYFLPPESLYKAIAGAALAGVKVELMLPRSSDILGVNAAARSYFDNMLKAGVHIYLYQEGFLHAKVVTIDEKLSIIGSANMDFRSMEHNFEITSLLYDRECTSMLNRCFEQDLNNSTELYYEDWKQRPLIKRLWESALRLFAPLM
ncbi:MAG: cardiolipin synthase [Porphyromonas sp.]|nr:cardiolipin synthase [Porphyromonas sp.]